MKEAEERKLALRRLGSREQQIITLDEAVIELATEALAPDQR